MPLTCKWKTKCSDCGDSIEEGDDIWLVESVDSGKERLCYHCATANGYICDCTNDKKPEYAMCWDCRTAEQQRTGSLCACGRYKRPQYPTCYACKQKGK